MRCVVAIVEISIEWGFDLHARYVLSKIIAVMNNNPAYFSKKWRTGTKITILETQVAWVPRRAYIPNMSSWFFRKLFPKHSLNSLAIVVNYLLLRWCSSSIVLYSSFYHQYVLNGFTSILKNLIRRKDDHWLKWEPPETSWLVLKIRRWAWTDRKVIVWFLLSKKTKTGIWEVQVLWVCRTFGQNVCSLYVLFHSRNEWSCNLTRQGTGKSPHILHGGLIKR